MFIEQKISRIKTIELEQKRQNLYQNILFIKKIKNY